MQIKKKLQEIIKDQQQFKRNIEFERTQRNVKTRIDGTRGKRRTIIVQFLNFKDKQQFLSKYKAQNLWMKNISINEDFSEDTMGKRKGLFQRAKELQEEGKFTNVVYYRLIVCDRRSRLENAEEGGSSV